MALRHSPHESFPIFTPFQSSPRAPLHAKFFIRLDVWRTFFEKRATDGLKCQISQNVFFLYVPSCSNLKFSRSKLNFALTKLNIVVEQTRWIRAEKSVSGEHTWLVLNMLMVCCISCCLSGSSVLTNLGMTIINRKGNTTISTIGFINASCTRHCSRFFTYVEAPTTQFFH